MAVARAPSWDETVTFSSRNEAWGYVVDMEWFGRSFAKLVRQGWFPGVAVHSYQLQQMSRHPQWRDWFVKQWSPYHPYATSDVTKGIFRTSREEALKHSLIELNCTAKITFLVVDIDRDISISARDIKSGGPMPNMVSVNVSNGHAHASWALRTPVLRTEVSSLKALSYCAAVGEGLRRACDGDPGYSGLMAKNPFSREWQTFFLTDRLYTLDELSSRLSSVGMLPSTSWYRNRGESPAGLGRNCTVFETVRHEAYREARRIRSCHRHVGPEEVAELARAVREYSIQVNGQFDIPLPHSEVEGICRSITRWVTTKYRGWLRPCTSTVASADPPQSLVELRRQGGIKGAQVRQRRTEKLIEALKEMKP